MPFLAPLGLSFTSPSVLRTSPWYSVGAVVVRQLLEMVGLRSLEEGPELVFGNEVVGVRDGGLFEHTIPVLADEKGRDVLLKADLGSLVPLGHGQGFRTLTR